MKSKFLIVLLRFVGFSSPFAGQIDNSLPDAAWTITNYTGADGHFDIYEDSGDGYA